MYAQCVCILTALFSLVSASFINAEELPEWILHPPKHDYILYGVGSGNVKEASQAKAKKEVVAQLEVSIKALETVETRSSSVESTTQTRHERLEEEVRGVVEERVNLEDLPGLTPEKHHVGEDGRFYSLVSFDRREWAGQIQVRVSEVDDLILAAREQHRKAVNEGTARNPVAIAVRLYQRVLPLALERETLTYRYSLAAPGKSLPKMPINMAGLRDYLSDLLNEITISLPEDESMKEMLPSLINGLSEYGIRVMGADAKSAMSIEGNLSVTYRQSGRMYRADAVLIGHVKVEGSSQHLAGLRLKSRGSAGSQEGARNYALDKLSEAMAEEIDRALLAQIANFNVDLEEGSPGPGTW